MVTGKNILLLVSGGIAASKCPDLVAKLRADGAQVRVVLTRGGSGFVSADALKTASGEAVRQNLFDADEEAEAYGGIGHIQLARWADAVLVAPATAHILARMAQGLADDLATTLLLATTAPVIVAPAMNTAMWQHPATEANIRRLQARGVEILGPGVGELACGEVGVGRMLEPADIVSALKDRFVDSTRMAGRRVLVTSGPTREAIDPVRFIANHSSGKQGHAIARAFAQLGAQTTLISGPVQLADPVGVKTIHVETARDMLDAAQSALPEDGVLDVAVCAAAVADWRVADIAAQKMKKTPGVSEMTLNLVANPDILATLSQPTNRRPRLVIGFAAETDHVVEHAQTKRINKGCDWIVANDVSANAGTFGGDENTVHVVDADGVEHWQSMAKTQVAKRLARRVADALGTQRDVSQGNAI